LLLKRNKKVARACGFKHETPSHGLFTQFRYRLGRDGYEKVFSLLLGQLLKGGVVKGDVIAVDGTAVKAIIEDVTTDVTYYAETQHLTPKQRL